MPHQCTKCGEIFPDAAKELLAGCTCGSKFFYYIRQERLDELNKINNSEIQDTLTELARADKVQIEKDIRDITGMAEEPDKPVITMNLFRGRAMLIFLRLLTLAPLMMI